MGWSTHSSHLRVHTTLAHLPSSISLLHQFLRVWNHPTLSQGRFIRPKIQIRTETLLGRLESPLEQAREQKQQGRGHLNLDPLAPIDDSRERVECDPSA